MGSATSKNVTDTTIKAVSGVTTTITSQIDLRSDQKQIITIRDVENLNLSGVTQRIRATIDMKALMDAMSTTDAQQEVISSMTQASNSMISGINLGNFSNATNELKSYLEAVLTLITTITQTCEAFSSTTQEIIIEQVSGYANISGITQDSMTGLMSDCMQTAVAETKSVMSLQQTIDQSAKAETVGIDPMGILIAIAIVIAALALMFAAGGKTATNLVSVIVFGVSGMLGLVFVGIFLLTIHEKMEITIFSTLISKSAECGGEVLEQLTTINDPVYAGNQCEQNELCVGFDWNSVRVLNTGIPEIIQPPITTYYSSLVRNPCKGVQDARDNQRIIFRPAVHRYQGPLPDRDLPGVFNRDVGLNEKRLEFYIFEAGIPWTKITPDNHLLKEPIVDDFNTENNTIFWESFPPNNEPTVSGDIWVDASNPATLQVYLRGSSEWTLNNEDLPSGGYGTDLGCRNADRGPPEGMRVSGAGRARAARRHLREGGEGGSRSDLNAWFQRAGAIFAEEDLDDDDDDDPGQDALPDICANVSGFKTTSYNFVFLLVGVLGIGLGIMGIATSTSKDKAADKKGGGIPIVSDVLGGG
jgi:hypothetical protein